MESFHLSDKVVDLQVSDVHLHEICCCSCTKWRLLYSYLAMDKTMVSDVERMNVSEEERRHSFFSVWRERKGSAATYQRLVQALLQAGCREDAEKVCKILATSLKSSSIDQTLH